MSATPTPTIPYEKQADPQSNRMCGAASLSMVYRSFDKTISQAEIWPRISKHNRLNRLAASTHLIAQDALNQGFAAVAIQAKHPLQALRLCQDKGIRVILNHRLKEDGPTGHFTVLVEIDGEHVVLHDPYFGPARRVRHAELLELWRPRYLNAEIAGDVLIGIAAPPAAVPPCPLCGTVIPPDIACPNCRKPVPLQPAALLGCMGAGCAGRMWNYLCCPLCDHTWTFGLETSQAKVAASSEEGLVDLNPLFTELDKFCDHILSLPAAADHPDVQKQIAFLKGSKDGLKLAQSEELARRRVHEAQTAQLQQKFNQEEEAILKKKEEINKPAPPLDGTALGQGLVKDLGLLSKDQPPPMAPPPKPAAPRSKPEAAEPSAARSKTHATVPAASPKPAGGNSVPQAAKPDKGMTPDFDTWSP